MARTVVTSKGIPIQIGVELGRGGEGSVFEIPSLSQRVAKLYHQLPDGKKQSKLAFMASTADPQLLNYVAWPLDTLHVSHGGPIVGFVMPKVAGRQPIHMVYSPAHRRQERPEAAWDFLLYVARNTAAAFEALHSHGHVLGDVNQGNVMVGGDSKVVLIDSDSFQVKVPGGLHLCEVGVAHFTAPELQGLSSFQGFARTPNHDNFGLALLIFHLLFGGRHPYSGVPLKSGVGDALETDIKGFRYAYARDAQSRGLLPPPRSIELSIVPDAMEAMFHLAFTEKGATGGRPSAKQWVVALDSLRTRLKKCATSAVHVYGNHLSKCPWCTLEQQGVIYFINLGATYVPTTSGFALTQVWALIEAISPPTQVSIPNVQGISVTPNPLPADLTGNAAMVTFRIAVLVLAVVGLALAPKAWILTAIAAWIGWAWAGTAGSSERQAERIKRKAAEEIAQKEFEQLVERTKKDCGPEGFRAKKEALEKIRDEYQSLSLEEKSALDNLHATAQARQKEKFLERFFIDSAEIPGVGPTRKATLRSFGIETAADVKRNRILQVRGFGDSLTRAVTDWRASCERRFVFNPATAVSEADRNAVRAKFGAKRAALATSLGAGPADLQRSKQLAMSVAASLQPQLEQAAKKLAQAKSDMTLI